VHDVSTKLDNTLESRGHVRHPKVGQREPIARPASALVQPERRHLAMALQALALRGAPPIESQPEQRFPELPRPRKVIGWKLDQLDRHHPFSLFGLGPGRRYRRTVASAAEILTSRFGYTPSSPVSTDRT
jgi:hypothetical protein